MISLTQNLSAGWKCDEASGNLVDYVGSNTGTAVGSPGATTGRIGGARTFDGTGNQRFTVADASGVSVGLSTDWTLYFRVKFTSIGSYPMILSKANTGGTNVEFECFVDTTTTNRINFRATNDVVTLVNALSAVVVTTGVWYDVCLAYSVSAGKISIQVNSETPVETTLTSGIVDSTETLCIGSRNGGGLPLNGAIDDIRIWKGRFLNQQERSVYRTRVPYNALDTIATFTQKKWASCHFSIATYTTLASVPSELAQASTHSINLFNPTNLNLERYFDEIVKLGYTGVMFTLKHWDGFCLWDSARSARKITNTTWWPAYQINVAKEVARLAKVYGLDLGIYFCVTDGYYELGGQTGTYTQWTVDLLTELFTLCPETKFLLLDGWGSTWATDFTDVDYETVMNAIPTTCVVGVNDHEGPSATGVHGHLAILERPADGEPAANITNFGAVWLWEPIHTNSYWFRHADSAADTLAGAQTPIGRIFRAMQNGYNALVNFSLAPDGSLASDTLELLRGFQSLGTPTVTENFIVSSPPQNLQTLSGWVRNYSSVNIQINPSQEAWVNDAGGSQYYYDKITFLNGRADFYFKLKSVPTNGEISVLIHENAGSTANDRVTFNKTGSSISLNLKVYNGGFTTLSSATLTDTLLIDTPYRVTIQKINTELQVSLWWQINGIWEMWGRLFGTSNTNSTAGYVAFYLADSTGSSTAGIHVTKAEIYEIFTPVGMVTIATDKVAIDRPTDMKYIKLYRDKTLVGFLEPSDFVSKRYLFDDVDIDDVNDYQYSAYAIDSNWHSRRLNGNVAFEADVQGSFARKRKLMVTSNVFSPVQA